MNELYHKGGGNPYHDELGRFTTKPGGSGYIDRHGNLTKAGIKRYESILERDHESAVNYFDTKLVDNNKSNAGVITKDGEDYVKKGSTFTRFTDKEEGVDNKRKYVSITEDDRKAYGQVAKEGFLGLKNLKDIREVQYTAIKDLKVADGKAVVDHLLKEYGDMKVSDVFKRTEANNDDLKVVRTALDSVFGGDDVRSIQKDVHRFDSVYDLDLTKYSGEDRKVVNAAMQYASTRERAMSGFYNQKIMTEPTKNNPVFDHFVKLGYDALVDAEDAKWANYPLILLNPASSVKYKRERPFVEYD